MNEFVVNDLKINQNAVVDWYMFCCEDCMVASVNDRAKLGGVGETVEIDEFVQKDEVWKKKSERKLDIWWVQRESNKCFF
ncbi:hypothetical protein TNCV_4367971 [Trichonephila clavipes]|nr:hypothetical protein TNCV_4367971 [Trichonephila clavipes]